MYIPFGKDKIELVEERESQQDLFIGFSDVSSYGIRIKNKQAQIYKRKDGSLYCVIKNTKVVR